MAENNILETWIAAILIYSERQKASMLGRSLFPKDKTPGKPLSDKQRNFIDTILAIYNDSQLGLQAKRTQIRSRIGAEISKFAQNEEEFSKFLSNLIASNSESTPSIEKAKKTNYNTTEGIQLFLLQRELSRKLKPVMLALSSLKKNPECSQSNRDLLNQALQKLKILAQVLQHRLPSPSVQPSNVSRNIIDDNEAESSPNYTQDILKITKNIDNLIAQAIKPLDFIATPSKEIKSLSNNIKDMDNNTPPQPSNLTKNLTVKKIKECLEYVNDYLSIIDKRGLGGTNKNKQELAINIRSRFLALLEPNYLEQLDNLTTLCNNIKEIIHSEKIKIAPANLPQFDQGQCGKMLKKLDEALVVKQDVNHHIAKLFYYLAQPVLELKQKEVDKSSSLIDQFRYVQYLDWYLENLSSAKQSDELNRRTQLLKREKDKAEEMLSETIKSEDVPNSADDIKKFFSQPLNYNPAETRKNSRTLANLAVFLKIGFNGQSSFEALDPAIQESILNWIQQHFLIQKQFMSVLSLLQETKEGISPIYEATLCIQIIQKIILERTNQLNPPLNVKHSKSEPNFLHTPKRMVKKSNSMEDKTLSAPVLNIRNSLLERAISMKDSFTDTLKAFLPSPISAGYTQLDAVYAASIMQSGNGRALYFMETLPHGPEKRAAYANACIVVGNELYLITENGKIDNGAALPIAKNTEFEKYISLTKRKCETEKSNCYYLSDSEFRQNITNNLEETAKKSLQQTEEDAVKTIVRNQIVADMTGEAYQTYMAPQLAQLGEETLEYTLCSDFIKSKQVAVFDENAQPENTSINIFINSINNDYHDHDQNRPFFTYARQLVQSHNGEVKEKEENNPPHITENRGARAIQYALLAACNDIMFEVINEKIELSDYFSSDEIDKFIKMRNFEQTHDLAASAEQSLSIDPSSPRRESDSASPGSFLSPPPVYRPVQLKQSSSNPKEKPTMTKYDSMFYLIQLRKKNAYFKKHFYYHYDKASQAAETDLAPMLQSAKATAKLSREIGKIKTDLKIMNSLVQSIINLLSGGANFLSGRLFSNKHQKRIEDTEKDLAAKFGSLFYIQNPIEESKKVNAIMERTLLTI